VTAREFVMRNLGNEHEFGIEGY
jgi:hypothetical protein